MSLTSAKRKNDIYFTMFCSNNCKTGLFMSLTSAYYCKIGELILLGVMQSRPKRDVQSSSSIWAYKTQKYYRVIIYKNRQQYIRIRFKQFKLQSLHFFLCFWAVSSLHIGCVTHFWGRLTTNSCYSQLQGSNYMRETVSIAMNVVC